MSGTLTPPYPNDQHNNASSIPVRIVGNSGSSSPYTYTPLGYQQLTVTGVVGLTAPSGSTIAFISVATSGVNYRDDGTNPTSTVGMPVSAGQQLQYSGALSSIKFIAQSGTPVLNISYYK